MKPTKLISPVHTKAVGLSASQMTVGCVAMFFYLIVYVLNGTHNELMHGVWGGGIVSNTSVYIRHRSSFTYTYNELLSNSKSLLFG